MEEHKNSSIKINIKEKKNEKVNIENIKLFKDKLYKVKKKCFSDSMNPKCTAFFLLPNSRLLSHQFGFYQLRRH